MLAFITRAHCRDKTGCDFRLWRWIKCRETDGKHAYQIDMICLAGFMRVLTAGFTDHWSGRMLNIHPSLLPKYKGLNTHARAIEAGDKRAGCTVHEVTAELDDGPILGQISVPILSGDTPANLAARVLVQEHQLYPAVLKRFAIGDKTPIMRET